MTKPFPADLLARFVAIVGSDNAVTDPAAMKPYLTEWRDAYVGRAPAVLRPGSTAEVAAILKLASATGTPVVPQGGNTGLVGGQIPDDSGSEIVVALGRLDRVRSVDAGNASMIVEAGVTLAGARAAADAADRLFPLSIGSEARCQIGGNLSTNAGGVAVLSYGNARDLTLGLEVVLPSGAVWDGLRTLRKDNTGYDLRQVFIGAEGTLGIITAAALKLFPRPRGMGTAMVGVASPATAVALLDVAKRLAGSALTSFELIARIGVDFALRHMPGAAEPLATAHPWYVLLEASSGRSPEDAVTQVEAILAEAMTVGLAANAVRAASRADAEAFWRLRYGMSELQKHEGGSLKHDVSVPIAAVPEFIAAASAAAVRVAPGCRLVPFGHLGDGNIHFNVSQPEGGDRAAFLARRDALAEAVHAVVARLGGSISAEHGIGQMKRDLLPGVKSPVEMALMRSLKAALDPAGIMNPGKLL